MIAGHVSRIERSGGSPSKAEELAKLRHAKKLKFAIDILLKECLRDRKFALELATYFSQSLKGKE